jgi:hypothetical protein
MARRNFVLWARGARFCEFLHLVFSGGTRDGFKVAYAPLWKAIASIRAVKNRGLGRVMAYTAKSK